MNHYINRFITVKIKQKRSNKNISTQGFILFYFVPQITYLFYKKKKYFLPPEKSVNKS